MHRSTWWNIGFIAAFVVGGWLAGRHSQAAVPTPDVASLQQEITALTTRVTAVESTAQGCFAHDSAGNWSFAPKAGNLQIRIPGNINTQAESALTIAAGTNTTLTSGMAMSVTSGTAFSLNGGTTLNAKAGTTAALGGTTGLTLSAQGPFTATGTPISLNGKTQ